MAKKTLKSTKVVDNKVENAKEAENMKNVVNETPKKSDAVHDSDKAMSILEKLYDSPEKVGFMMKAELPLNKPTTFKIRSIDLGYKPSKNFAWMNIHGEIKEGEIQVFLGSKVDPDGTRCFGDFHGGHIMRQLKISGRHNLLTLYKELVANHIGDSLTVIKTINESDDGQTQYTNYKWA